MNMTAESLDVEPNRSVFVALRADSAVAKPTLAEAYALAKRAAVTPAPTTTARRSGAQHKPAINALLLKSVFGDELALRHAIEPVIGAGSGFSLVWSGDEDVIFRFTDPAPADAETRLRSLRSALAFHPEVHAASVEGVRVDPTSGEIVVAAAREAGAAPAISRASSSSWAGRAAGMPSTTNSFAALSVNDASSSSSPAMAEPKQRWTTLGGVVARGLNQAPYAVVAPSHAAPPPEEWDADD